MRRLILVAILASSLVSTLVTLLVVGTSNPAPAQAQVAPNAGPGLTGAWLVSSSRSTGEGVVLLTFTSDGTFFRSGDTHPVLSVAHGVWTQVGDGEFEASHIALRFDENRAHIGSQTTRIHITVGANPGEFTGLTRGRILGLDGSVQVTTESQLRGTRITLEPFDS